MLKMTMITNKQLVDRKTGESLGKALCLVWDNLLRKCLICTDIGTFAVAKTNLSQNLVATILPETAEPPRFAKIRLGTPVYDTNGCFVGKISEITLSGTLSVLQIFVGEKEYCKKQIFAVGDVVLVKTPSAKQIFLAENPKPQKTPPQQPQQPQEPAAGLRRRYGNFDFLIGKTVDKTVTNFQGEVMIRQDGTITPEILRQAKISGKLLELYLHVR